jgi:hypothetical protein
MASNLDCVGLGVADSASLGRLVDGALANAQLLAEINGVSILRWQDPSGASVVALGVDVSVHADAEAFGSSDASLLGNDHGDPGDPPAHYVAQGLPWPPRMAAESLISYGVFGPAEQAEAYARLHGTVLHAEPRTVAATGQQFVVARVRTTGFDVDMCLPTVRVPTTGSIIGGTLFLTASLSFATTATQPRKRAWRPWKR